MKKLRSLLIDCRIALRKQFRDFQKTELCEKLDEAINQLSAYDAEKSTSASEPAIGLNKTHTTNQVGLAWQRAARDLKFSQPDLYKKLSDDVMRLLDTKTLVDPGAEFEQLGTEVLDLKQAQVQAQKDYQTLVNERDALLGALAQAVPQLDDSADRFATALARIQWLDNSVKTAQLQFETKAEKDKQNEGPMPSDDTLTHIISGQRSFSKDQLDWAIGEAMVLCGFQYTPNELLDRGQAHIAQVIQTARGAKV
jgi:hypothetical protein